MRRLLLVLFVASTAAATLPTLVASAGVPSDALSLGLESPVAPLTFSAFVDDVVTCDTVTVNSVEANGTAVIPLAVVPYELNPNLVSITLPPDTAPGTLDVAVECVDGEFPLEYIGSIDWAALAVTKVVSGTVPAGATFVVDVDCGESMFFNEAIELAYGPTGGTEHVYVDERNWAECAITEPVNGGAVSTTITPSTVDLSDARPYTATVTNTFPIPVVPAFTG